MICDLTKPINPGESKTITLVMNVSEARELSTALYEVMLQANPGGNAFATGLAPHLKETFQLYSMLLRTLQVAGDT